MAMLTLEKLLYWTVINMIGSGAQPSHIRDFYAKRQATASRRKPLLVACIGSPTKNDSLPCKHESVILIRTRLFKIN